MNQKFLLNHFERITEAPQAIIRLRRFILELALRGKLVPQDATDEPTVELLQRIGLERERLIKSGEIWNRESVSLVEDKEIPYKVPLSWRWARVAAVSESRLGKMLDKGKNKGTPRRYLRNINVRWFDFDLSDVLEMRFEDEELEEFSLRSGDVLICEGGEPGRSAVWDSRELDIYFQKAIHRVRFFCGIVPSFFVLALSRDAQSGRLPQFFTGTGIQHFTGKGLARYSFPVPPLAEQHRIVAKVDELMGLCDRLEAALRERESLRSRLLEAVLREAISV